jgi:tetratricopeptide (TPR) repeat protein
VAKPTDPIVQNRGRSLLVAFLGVFLACSVSVTAPPQDTSAAGPARGSEGVQGTLAQFNRGAALLEQYRYAEAAKALEQVLAAVPNWPAARFNLGLAYLNMQEEAGAKENLERAKEAFESVLNGDPNHLHARFGLGLYCQHTGDNAKAAECFRLVYQGDPNDPYAAYKYAEALLSLDDKTPAQELLEGIIKLDPGFVSAFYRLATLYQRGGQREKATSLFARFRELKDAELTGGSFTVLNAYGTVGKYYMALGPDSLPLPPQANCNAPVFQILLP